MTEHRKNMSDKSDMSDSFDIVAVIRSYMERAQSDMSDSSPTGPTRPQAGRTGFYQQKQSSPTCPTRPTQIADDGVARTPEAIEALWDAAIDRARRIAAVNEQNPETSPAPRGRDLPTQPPLCCVSVVI